MFASIQRESELSGGEFARFAFRIAIGPICKGLLGGIGVLLCLAVWGDLSGRLKNADEAYWGIALFSALVAVLLVAWVLIARTRLGAAGGIETDAQGIRWRRGDATIGFDALWPTVHSATIDRRQQKVLLKRTNHTDLLINGIDGHLELERFAELVQLVALHVPVAQHVGALDRAAARPAARRAIFVGAACGLVSLVLYGTNRALGTWLHWTRLIAPIPLLVAGSGLITFAAGLRLWFGRGPLVSPIYSPGYSRAMVRFLVIAVIADFIVIAIENGF